VENKKAWIYIHIPKTAGQFVKSRIIETKKNTSKIIIPFLNDKGFSPILKFHPNISFVKKQISLSNDERVGFIVIVRNPYDRLYSLWKWSTSNGNHSDVEFPGVEKKFEDYIISLGKSKYDGFYFMQKQTFWFIGEENSFVKIMKFEELNTTVKTFFENNGITWSNKKINAILGQDYRDVYTPKIRDMVIERCHEEFERFGYSLDL